MYLIIINNFFLSTSLTFGCGEFIGSVLTFSNFVAFSQYLNFIWFDFSYYLIIINNIFLLVNQFDIWFFGSFRWRKSYWLYINFLNTDATDVATVFDDRGIIYRPLSSSCKKNRKRISLHGQVLKNIVNKLQFKSFVQ